MSCIYFCIVMMKRDWGYRDSDRNAILFPVMHISCI